MIELEPALTRAVRTLGGAMCSPPGTGPLSVETKTQTDLDPGETAEWIEVSMLGFEGRQRARFVLGELISAARRGAAPPLRVRLLRRIATPSRR
jgi:hypothetical protein